MIIHRPIPIKLRIGLGIPKEYLGWDEMDVIICILLDVFLKVCLLIKLF